MNYLEIGERIRKHRKLLGLTREELAEMLDLTPRYCYDIELGNKGMSIETLESLTKILNISADYILFGEKEEEDGVLQCVSLIERCPQEKREHLSRIMSEFVQAMTE